MLNHLNGNEIRPLSINKTEFQDEFEFFVVYTNDWLEKGSVYEIYIPFNGDLTQSLLGYYRSSYDDKQTNEKR